MPNVNLVWEWTLSQNFLAKQNMKSLKKTKIWKELMTFYTKLLQKLPVITKLVSLEKLNAKKRQSFRKRKKNATELKQLNLEKNIEMHFVKLMA